MTLRVAKTKPDRVRLTRAGLSLGSTTLPLLVGSVHYWRLDPDLWRDALEAVQALGLKVVDTYVPWSVHERSPGHYEFGENERHLDIGRFLELAQELGLYACVRPGPHVNAELTQFGIPERIIWDPQCQALSARGARVVLPVPPLAFPVPSYASRAFLREASLWLKAVGARIAPHCYPRGPVVMVQVDNEGAMYFRDGVYDQDYHPDAIRAYHKFLKRKYGSPAALSQALGRVVENFELEPPRGLDASTSRELTPHLDWAESQEEMLSQSFGKMREALEEAGVNVPFSHNFPIGETLTPLDPKRVQKVVDLVGLDYYHAASPSQRQEIARRTSDLAARSEAEDVPAFACEIGAGFPPFFPPLTETDNTFTALTALAYGLKGYNLYMVVERDRWIGAPYDRHVRVRPSARNWQNIARAIETLKLPELRRRTAVNLVVPRSVRRLHRVLHAFGPLSAAIFQIMGRGAIDAGLEEELDFGAPFAIDAERFVRWFEEELERRRVPFGVLGGDLIEHSLEHALWTVVACAGGLEESIGKPVHRAISEGRAVSLGPHYPQRDEAWIPREPRGTLRHAFGRETQTLLDLDPDRLRHVVDRAMDALKLPTLPCSPAELSITLHEDSAGVPRVLFVINPTAYQQQASVTSCGMARAEDALDASVFHANNGVLELPVPPHTVRMLALGN